MDFSQPFGGLMPGSLGAVLSALLRTATPLTGRQIHRLVGEGHSLASTQRAIGTLVAMGLIEVTPAGRANLHVLNPAHYAISPLRTLLDPIAVLRLVVAELVDDTVQAVLLFGSVARGEATEDSDIDLAVIAPDPWPGRVDLQQAVVQRLGNRCDVVAITKDMIADGIEPVVRDILRDGVALYGVKPQNGK